MAIEQTLFTRLVVNHPAPKSKAPDQPTIQKDLPEQLLDFVAQSDSIEMSHQESITLEQADQVKAVFDKWQKDHSDFPTGFVVLERLNDIRFINKFLEEVNEKLATGGYIVGSVETSIHRKQRIKNKLPRWLFRPYYLIDFLVTRVWPKLPRLRKAYFALSHGRNRVISKMEVYGRLYSCGFQIEQTLDHDDKLFFIAKKVALPDYNLHPTYGPLIRLNRVGKNGKMIKVYKFRTMSPYSEYLQAYIYEQCGLQEGGKLKDDPRVNTVGRFMRKYWLDELPMIYNLLKGDMKLFGVRPISAHYLSLYPKDCQERRKSFKPGLIPPFYADLPKTIEEIAASEMRYLEAYEKSPLLTDLRYLGKVAYNILVKMARSN